MARGGDHGTAGAGRYTPYARSALSMGGGTDANARDEVTPWAAGPSVKGFWEGRERLSLSGRPCIFLPGARQLAVEAAAFTLERRGKTASDVREQMFQRARSMTTMCTLADIERDTSSLALRPVNPGLLAAMLEAAQRALARRQPATTAKQDKSNWKFWCEWASLMGTTPLRTDAQANAGLNAFHGRELAMATGAFIYWCLTSSFKPKSMMSRLFGVARRHKQLQCNFVSLSLVSEVCKGVVQEYIDEMGADWIAEKRKEPVTNEMLRAWLGLAAGLRIGAFTVGRNLAWQGIRVFLTLCAASGFRCSDVALESGLAFNGNRHLSMSDVRWEVDGTRVTELPAELLATLAAGLHTACVVFVLITAPPSKADADGTRWRASPISVQYDSTAPINLVREMARYEEMRQLSATTRRAAPVLVDEHGRPWRRAALNAVFKLLLLAIPQLIPREMVKHYSVHSFRIYLACALLAVGATPETIKLMVRWASDEALQIYARLNVAVDAALRASATSARVHSVRSSTMAATAAPVWQEEPTALELQRRAQLRAQAANVSDVAAVDKGRLPQLDLHAQIANLDRGLEAAKRKAEKSDARLAEDGVSSESDDCE